MKFEKESDFTTKGNGKGCVSVNDKKLRLLSKLLLYYKLQCFVLHMCAKAEEKCQSGRLWLSS